MIKKGEISALIQGVFLSPVSEPCGTVPRIRPGRQTPPASYGDASQGLVVAGFAFLVLMFPDAIVDFLAVNTQMIGYLEAELDLSSLYAEDTDADIVANMDTFSCAAIQYLHTVSPC